jgi:hypothetical protein
VSAEQGWVGVGWGGWLVGWWDRVGVRRFKIPSLVLHLARMRGDLTSESVDSYR